MKKIFIPFLSLILLTQLTSCIGYSIKSDSTPISNFSQHKRDTPQKDWKYLIVYDGLDESDKYTEIAKIVITGNASATEEKLLKKLRKEAGRYHADAILHVETREVDRTSFDGISTGINILSIFLDGDVSMQLDMGGDYTTLEVEGIAIRFLEN